MVMIMSWLLENIFILIVDMFEIVVVDIEVKNKLKLLGLWLVFGFNIFKVK